MLEGKDSVLNYLQELTFSSFYCSHSQTLDHFCISLDEHKQYNTLVHCNLLHPRCIVLCTAEAEERRQYEVSCRANSSPCAFL